MLKYLRTKSAAASCIRKTPSWRIAAAICRRRGTARVEEGLRNGGRSALCVVATGTCARARHRHRRSRCRRLRPDTRNRFAATWQLLSGARAAAAAAEHQALMGVCASGALDQFLAREPEYLLRAGAEEARIDPSNVEILVQHLKCAAFEAPFVRSSASTEAHDGASPSRRRGAGSRSEPRRQGPRDRQVATRRSTPKFDCATRSSTSRRTGLVHASGRSLPLDRRSVSCDERVAPRNVGWDNFVIVDLDTGQVHLAEARFSRRAHDAAREQGHPYQQRRRAVPRSRSLDYDDHKAFVHKVDPDYFHDGAHLPHRRSAGRDGSPAPTTVARRLGWSVKSKSSRRSPATRRVKFFTHENAGYEDVNRPARDPDAHDELLGHPFPRVARWNELPQSRAPEAVEALPRRGRRARKAVATLALMCEPSDIGSHAEVTARSRTTKASGAPLLRGPQSAQRPLRAASIRPCFLFDAVPGGVQGSRRENVRKGACSPRSGAQALIAGCGPGVKPGALRASVRASRGRRKGLSVAILGLLVKVRPATGSADSDIATRRRVTRGPW